MALSAFDRWIWRSVRRLSVLARGASPVAFTGTRAVLAKPDDVRRILLVRTDKIGDVIVSTPVFEVLRKRFPEAEIDMVLGRKNGVTAPMVAHLDRIFHASKRVSAILSLLGRIRRRRYDVAIDMLTGDSMTSALYTVLSGAKVAIGFDDKSPSIYDVPVPRPVEPEHEVIYLLRLLEPLGISRPLGPKLSIVLPQKALENAQALAPALRRDGRKLVMINISGSSPQKYWGTANYARLARELESSMTHVVLLSAPGDAASLSEIVAASGAEVLQPVPDLIDFSARLSLADMVITPDTSIVHIAAALDKPVLALAGSAYVSAEWHAWGVPNRSIHCDGGVPNIPYEDVLAAVRDLMAETGIGSAPREAHQLSQRVS